MKLTCIFLDWTAEAIQTGIANWLWNGHSVLKSFYFNEFLSFSNEVFLYLSKSKYCKADRTEKVMYQSISAVPMSPSPPGICGALDRLVSPGQGPGGKALANFKSVTRGINFN